MFIIQPSASADEFLVKIAEMSHRPAEAGATELEENAEETKDPVGHRIE